MERSEKAEAVEALKVRFQKACVTVLADYKGLKVSQMTKLRQELRQGKAELKVVKNTLAVLALQGTEMESLGQHFIGTVAVVTSETDPVAPAKILVKFAKDNEKAKIKAGFLSGKLMSSIEVEALSKLPSREEMLAKLLGSMMAPAQNLYNVITALPRQFVTVLAAVRDKKSS